MSVLEAWGKLKISHVYDYKTIVANYGSSKAASTSDTSGTPIAPTMSPATGSEFRAMLEKVFREGCRPALLKNNMIPLEFKHEKLLYVKRNAYEEWLSKFEPFAPRTNDVLTCKPPCGDEIQDLLAQKSCEPRGDMEDLSAQYKRALPCVDADKMLECLSRLKADEEYLCLIAACIKCESNAKESKDSKALHELMCEELMKHPDVEKCSLVLACIKLHKVGKADVLRKKCAKVLKASAAKCVHDPDSKLFARILSVVYEHSLDVEGVVWAAFRNLPAAHHKMILAEAYVSMQKGDWYWAKCLLRECLLADPGSEEIVLQVLLGSLDGFSEVRDAPYDSPPLDVCKGVFRLYESKLANLVALGKVWAFVDVALAAHSKDMVVECLLKATEEVIVYSRLIVHPKPVIHGLFCLAKEILSAVHSVAKGASVSSEAMWAPRLLRIYTNLERMVGPLMNAWDAKAVDAFEEPHCDSLKHVIKNYAQFRAVTLLSTCERMDESLCERALALAIMNHFTVTTLRFCASNQGMIPQAAALQCLLRGCVEGWSDDDFDSLRLKTMEALLRERKSDIWSSVEMQLAPFPKDGQGFLIPGPLRFSSHARKFTRIRGFSCKGEFKLLTEYDGTDIVTEQHVHEVLSQGIDFATVMMQPVGKYHPFNRFKCWPQLQGTECLEAMKAADCVLKGSLISTVPPFKLKSSPEMAQGRFSVEARLLDVDEKDDVFLFNDVEMSISGESPDYAAVAKEWPVFALLKEIFKLQAVVRLLKEKRESLSAPFDANATFHSIMKLLEGYPHYNESNLKLQYDKAVEKLKSIGVLPMNTAAEALKMLNANLDYLRSEGKYPINTEARFASEMDDLFRRNNMTREEAGELKDVESTVREQLQQMDSRIVANLSMEIQRVLVMTEQQHLNEVTKEVALMLMQTDSEVRRRVSAMLKPWTNDATKILNRQMSARSFQELVDEARADKLRRFDEMLAVSKISLPDHKSLVQSGTRESWLPEPWLPAAFCRGEEVTSAITLRGGIRRVDLSFLRRCSFDVVTVFEQKDVKTARVSLHNALKVLVVRRKPAGFPLCSARALLLVGDKHQLLEIDSCVAKDVKVQTVESLWADYVIDGDEWRAHGKAVELDNMTPEHFAEVVRQFKVNKWILMDRSAETVEGLNTLLKLVE